MQEIRIQLRDRPTTDTHILIGRGCRHRLRRELTARFGERPYVLIGDERVLDLWRDDLGLDPPLGSLELPAGEAAKTPAILVAVCRELCSVGLPRDGIVVALGGGAAGDVTALAASLHLRGVPVVQIPTTLLAMVDAAIGGKCAVNLPEGKNLFGTFHHPDLVLVDPEFLETLPEIEFRAGLGEVAKYAIGFSPELATELEARGLRAVPDALATCLRIKSAIVEEDPFEAGSRARLNLGHTLAHALEAWASARGYELPHGLAVALGLRAACTVAVTEGNMQPAERQRAIALLDTLHLPARTEEVLPQRPADSELLPFVQRDKKRRGGVLRVVLPRGFGACEVTELAAERLVAGLD